MRKDEIFPTVYSNLVLGLICVVKVGKNKHVETPDVGKYVNQSLKSTQLITTAGYNLTATPQESKCLAWGEFYAVVQSGDPERGRRNLKQSEFCLGICMRSFSPAIQRGGARVRWEL